MDKRVRQVLDGTIGEFWTVADPHSVQPTDDDEEMRTGFVRMFEDALEVRLLQQGDPFDSFGRSVDVPVGIVGATEHAGVIVVGILGADAIRNLGGGRASVERYTARTLLCDPSAPFAESTHIVSASGHFPGNALLAWADIDAVERKTTLNAKRRVTGATIRLKSAPDLLISLTRSLQLRLSGHWSLGEDEDLRHVVETALEVQVESSRPRDTIELLRPLLRCQELLCLAFYGFVKADGGRARLPGIDERAQLWDAVLMPSRVPANVRPATVNTRPIFHLADIGGVTGVARWIRLCGKHPRAVSAIVSPFRRGIGSNEVRLMELAAAIEYWVAAHRRRGRWTRKGESPAEAIAEHVGSLFGRWVQDPAKWAEVFWDHYNKLKHDPAFTPDGRTVAALQESAQLLLTAEILIRVAGTKQPAQRLLTDYRYERLGAEVRKILSD